MSEEKVEKENGESGTCEYSDLVKIAEYGDLMKECLAIARQAVQGEFAVLADDPKMQDTFAEVTCRFAVALFQRASAPDPSKSLMMGLEKVLEWYTTKEEKEKEESAKRDKEFRESIGAGIHGVISRPPRIATPLETLMSSLLSFASRYSEMEMTRLSDKASEVPETEIGRSCPTS